MEDSAFSPSSSSAQPCERPSIPPPPPPFFYLFSSRGSNERDAGHCTATRHPFLRSICRDAIFAYTSQPCNPINQPPFFLRLPSAPVTPSILRVRSHQSISNPGYPPSSPLLASFSLILQK